MKEVAVVYEAGPNNWSAYVLDLPGCIATGKTFGVVQRRIKEAIEFHLEAVRADGDPVPEPTIRVEGVQVS